MEESLALETLMIFTTTHDDAGFHRSPLQTIGLAFTISRVTSDYRASSFKQRTNQFAQLKQGKQR